MRRSRFVALGAAALALPVAARAQVDADPAMTSASPSLRVLLGNGQAEANSGGDGFIYNGRPYRGSFAQLPDGRIVNLVTLEAYLYSVVPREMPSSWPPAALQAQAVCARTYVLQRSNPLRPYDLVPSEADQVYVGIAGETPSGREAVDASAGQVLQYAGRAASVAYSSCCGGHTESSSGAWGGQPIPYLEGVVCPYDSASPNFRWTEQVPLETVAARFSAQLALLGALQDVRIAGTDRSGRARSFELICAQGSTAVKGSAFRLEVGPRLLRSLLIVSMQLQNGFNPSAESAQVLTIEGGGLGHGVGLCQWGACGMARGGAAASSILAWYFPGTNVGSLSP